MIGESCRDIFSYCVSERLAPDLPIPILKEVRRVENPGMAANVSRNLEALGLEVSLETNTGWERITKTRYVDVKSNHAFFRLDSDSDYESIGNIPDMTNFSAVVVSDYNKGFLSKHTIQSICESHENVFLDTKKVLGDWAMSAKIIKINDFEYRNSEQSMSDALKLKTIRTLGEEGAEFRGKVFPGTPVDVRDSSGAGDIFLAVFVATYLETGSAEESIREANRLAAWAVSKRGVSVVGS